MELLLVNVGHEIHDLLYLKIHVLIWIHHQQPPSWNDAYASGIRSSSFDYLQLNSISFKAVQRLNHLVKLLHHISVADEY